MRKFFLALVGMLVIPTVMLLVGWSIIQDIKQVADQAATKAAFTTTFGIDPPTKDGDPEKCQPFVREALDSLFFDVSRANDLYVERFGSKLSGEHMKYYVALTLAQQRRYDRAIQLAREYHIDIAPHPIRPGPYPK